MERGGVAGIRLRVDAQASPGKAVHDAGTDRRGVLADASGEGERVEPAHRGHHRAGMAHGPVDEMADGEVGLRRSGREQRAHVGAAAEAPEPALAVQDARGALDAVL